jgi:hypothetical protein
MKKIITFQASIILCIIFFVSFKTHSQTLVELSFNETFSNNNAYQKFEVGNVKLQDNSTGKLILCSGKNYRGNYMFKLITPIVGFISTYEIILENLPIDSYIKFSSSNYINISSRDKNIRFVANITDYQIGYNQKNEEIENKKLELQKAKVERDRLNSQNKKLNETIKVRNDTISAQIISINKLKVFIEEYKLKIESLNNKVGELESQIDSLKKDITNLEQYIQCQTGKNKELIEILVSQREKLYLYNMKMINCQCELFEKKKRKGQATFSFNIISTNNSLIEDSVFIQGEKENMFIDLYMRHRKDNKSDSLKNIPFEFKLDGSPLFVKIGKESISLDEKEFNKINNQIRRENLEYSKNKSRKETRNAIKNAKNDRKLRLRRFEGKKALKSSIGSYEFIVKNSAKVEIGKKIFYNLESTCKERPLKRKQIDGYDIIILPENSRVFNSINTDFNIYETEAATGNGIVDGDIVSLYECDSELKDCEIIKEKHLIKNNNASFVQNVFNHTFKHEKGFILTKQIVEGKAKGCSVTIGLNDLKKGDNTLKLTPSIGTNPVISGFKYEIDPVTWWLCNPPKK